MGKHDPEFVKSETLRLYDLLPQSEDERKQRLDVRDQIIDLNYSFFGYVASHTYINNTSITYEDKLQSALMHFCECWWWYKYEAKYRTDLAFSVFFKPRLGEMIERELNEVKYTVRRSLCQEVGSQVGKHWGKVRYEDLSSVELPADKLMSLKAIFGTMYWADLDEHTPYLEAQSVNSDPFSDISNGCNSLEDLLVYEIICRERKLTYTDLAEIADMYSVDLNVLVKLAPQAERTLYQRLHDRLAIIELYEN